MQLYIYICILKKIYLCAKKKKPMVTWWLVGSCLKHDAKESIVSKALCALLVFFFTFLLQLKVLPAAGRKEHKIYETETSSFKSPTTTCSLTYSTLKILQNNTPQPWKQNLHLPTKPPSFFHGNFGLVSREGFSILTPLGYNPPGSNQATTEVGDLSESKKFSACQRRLRGCKRLRLLVISRCRVGAWDRWWLNQPYDIVKLDRFPREGWK